MYQVSKVDDLRDELREEFRREWEQRHHDEFQKWNKTEAIFDQRYHPSSSCFHRQPCGNSTRTAPTVQMSAKTDPPSALQISRSRSSSIMDAVDADADEEEGQEQNISNGLMLITDSALEDVSLG